MKKSTQKVDLKEMFNQTKHKMQYMKVILKKKKVFFKTKCCTAWLAIFCLAAMTVLASATTLTLEGCSSSCGRGSCCRRNSASSRCSSSSSRGGSGGSGHNRRGPRG